MSEPILAAVLGSPIAQSLSPAIHEAAFRAAGRNGRYIAVECREDGLADVLERLRSGGAVGVSVTMPCKEAVVDLCDELAGSAAVLRAVNCVEFADGRTVGHNTDGDGCCDALIDQASVTLGGSRVVILGAGGTARSVAHAMLLRGADVNVINRTEARTDELVSMLKNETGGNGSIRSGTIDDVAGARVVVNATSVGMGTDECPLDPRLLHPGLTILDAVYHPLMTSLLSAAESVGATIVDGLWMLIHQARRQQEIWFGERPDAAPMRVESERVLRDRSN